MEELIHTPEVITPSDNKTLSLVSDKKEFKPTPEQSRFLDAALNPEVQPSLEEWCKKASVAYQSFLIWRKDPSFVDWFIAEVESGMRVNKVVWLKIGLLKMYADKEYWKAMGEIFYPHGFEEPITDGSERSSLEATYIKMVREATRK